MTDAPRVAFLVALVGVLFLTAGVGTVAAQSAPDCSTVTYNGAGTEANPYEVGNVDQLQCIEEQNLDASYEVASDIDASETSSWNSGKGFEPIGEITASGELKFNGTFDGQDYNITDLTIDRGSDFNTGLFDAVRSGTITNIGVVDADINGEEDVGGLVGFNEGTISESYVTGTISGGDDEVGGLVGTNDGGTIEKSYATALVEGADDRVGGLAGENFGTINKSYATGEVDGGDDNVGGLVGKNIPSLIGSSFTSGGKIKRSYATGDVNGSNRVGGLVADNFPGGKINDSYATGSVNSNGEVGGLVADNRGTVSDSYWDTQATGQSTSDGGTGLTTPEMKGDAATSNMLGFDFTDTWETVTNPDDYPILTWQTQTGSSPANFEVSIDSTNSPVPEGDTLQITATVTNTGGQQDTQDITGTASGLGSVTRTVMLDGDESRTETVSIPTSQGDAGSFTITVSSDDDTATTTVTVQDAGGGGSVVDNYRNSNGNVDTGGLQQAINDFIQDPNVDTGDLQAVINAFIQS